MKKNVVLLITLIVSIAFTLRVWDIGSVPISLDWDEVALGYNAYSLLHTGKDEYGVSFPVLLRSFGDYKPALYTYLIIPFLSFFDLSAVAVRLPSVSAGTLAVLLTFLIVRMLWKKDSLALWASFLLSISPWHIQMSRAAFEANVGVTANLLTLFFFLKSFQKSSFLLLAGVCAGLSMYTYQSEKVFMPLFVSMLVLVYKKQLQKISLSVRITALVAFVGVLLPLLVVMATNQASFARFYATSVFASHGGVNFQQRALFLVAQSHAFLPHLLNNHYVFFVISLFGGYLAHFNINWLFVTGDIPRHHAPGMGLLYLWELPLLLIGIYTCLSRLIKKDESTQSFLVLLFWFLLAPIPAAFTADVPHSIRTLNFLPTFSLFVAFGMQEVLTYLQRKALWQQYVLKIGGAVVMLFFFLYYLNQYFVQQNYFYSQDWQYGYKDMVAKVNTLKGRYTNIVISNEVPMDQSYIFFLFYSKYDPSRYQEETKGRSEHQFSSFTFRPIRWKDEVSDDHTLFVGSRNDFPSNITALSTFASLNNESAMLLVSGKKE